MTRGEWIDEYADESGNTLAVMEPREDFDPCIAGVVDTINGRAVLYDRGAVFRALVAGGMPENDAAEWYSFNMVGAGMWAFVVARPLGGGEQ